MNDNLEWRLIEAFGPEAAEREQRAIAESDCDPVEAVQRVVDERRQS